MSTKKLKFLILLVIFFVVLLLGLYSFGDIKYSSKGGLSYAEKKADAEYLMSFLEKTYPYFDEVKATTGQDLLKEKSKIINSISKTSSDKEFYFQIKKVLRRFLYGQINLGTDSKSDSYLHLDKVLENQRKGYFDKLSVAKQKWAPIQRKYIDSLSKSFKYTCNIDAMYINGNYYITMSQNPEVHLGDEVVGVNGMPVEEYLKTIPSDKMFTFYDYTRDKYVAHHLFCFENHIPQNVIIKNSNDEEKKVPIASYTSTEPVLEDGFKSVGTNSTPARNNKDQSNFLNIFAENKIVALNFSQLSDDANNAEELDKLFTVLDENDYVVLDLRGNSKESLARDILTFVLPMNSNCSNYNIMEKNEINDAFIEHYRISNHPFTTEITSPIPSIEKLYPLSKYYIIKNKTTDFSGVNIQKGRVFILYDNSVSSVINNEILKTAIDGNYCTVIANNKFTLMDYTDSSLAASVILPNSNLIVTAQNVKVVDSNGTFIEKAVVTPQMIIKEDTAKIIDKLKKGEGYKLEMPLEDRYTSKDEYYNEVLKLIK